MELIELTLFCKGKAGAHPLFLFLKAELQHFNAAAESSLLIHSRVDGACDIANVDQINSGAGLPKLRCLSWQRRLVFLSPQLLSMSDASISMQPTAFDFSHIYARAADWTVSDAC